MTTESRRDAILTAIVLTAIFAIALVFSHASFDMFRLPKTLLLRGEAILIAAVSLAAMILAMPVRRKRPERILLVPLAAFATMALVTVTSTKPALSADALASGAATLIVFLATLHTARSGGWAFVAVPLAAAVMNAVLILMQASNVWMPFGVRPDVPRPLQNTALAGNPNEVGGYIGVAALAALAALQARRGEPGRAWRVIAIASLAAGVIATRSLTAMIAVAAAAVVMFAMVSWRAAVAAAAAVAVIGTVLIAFPGPFRDRAVSMARWAKSGDYNSMITDRATPFVAASLMFVDHPWTGVGPGAFAWHYYEYKIRAEEKYPVLRRAYNRGVNYGEVHNDHLQVAAEGGVIGYAAFVLVVAMLASRSFGGGDDRGDARWIFARRLALPLAVFWVVLSLAQFPVETAVVRTLLAHFAALCLAWGRA
jgi:O-antigen ligase